LVSSCGWVVGTCVQVLVAPNHFISTCSPVQLYSFIKGWLVCGLPVTHAPQIPLGSSEKSRGISPVLGFHFWPNLAVTQLILWDKLVSVSIRKRKNMFIKFSSHFRCCKNHTWTQPHRFWSWNKTWTPPSVYNEWWW
jgi:hypothetical protein